MPVRGGIFTSYRRADSAALAGRIADLFSHRYPDSQRDKIRAVVHDGRVERGMPPFPGLTIPHQVNDVIAFIRDQTKQLNSKPGGRRGVAPICKLATLSKAKRISMVLERPIRAANTKSTHSRSLILSNSKNTPTTISII
jgi:hypothetical protein